MDSTLLEQSRQTAAALGVSFSSFAESALRDKVLASAAFIAADYERAQGRDTADYFAEVEAERAAMADEIRAAGAGW
ncbi:hypothetical protein [Nocardia sp. NPDC059229]|uniref:hypothetical protein n=1 Tax=Nocardia sp. NPDC059229 TaxID=3346778 RepID=UPI00368D7205